MWEDLRVGPGKLKHDFEKFALVGGPEYVQWGMELDNYIISGEVKTFPIDELQETWDWVNS